MERDQLFNSIAALKAQEKDLLDFVKRNEAMDNERAEKIKNEAKVSWKNFPEKPAGK